MKLKVVERRMESRTKYISNAANVILEEYTAEGHVLSMKQLFYRLVARGVIKNRRQGYIRLSNLVTQGRLGGRIDWDFIPDTTRRVSRPRALCNPKEALADCISQYRTDLWATQIVRPEIWVEKDSLAPLVADVCRRHGVVWQCTRGYMSQAAIYAAALRFKEYARKGNRCVLFHVGDHDPTGLDILRDTVKRLSMFGVNTDVERIALTQSQISQFDVRPKPIRMSDVRFKKYINKFGRKEWEIEALEPSDLVRVIDIALCNL